MIGAAALFAVMAIFVGAAHERDPSLSMFAASAWRSAINLIMLIIVVKGNFQLLFGDRRPALWARGVLGAGSLFTYFAAIALLSAGEAAFLNQTSAVWVAVLAPWVLGEKTPRMVWFAIAGSLIGMALLVHPREVDGDGLGRFIGLASGMFAAGAYLSIRAAGRSNPPEAIVFWFTIIGVPLGVFATWATGGQWPRDPIVILHLFGAGISATFAQLLMTQAYRSTRAGVVAAASAAGPLFTTALGAIFLGQIPDPRSRLGMAILAICAILLPLLAERQSTESSTA